MGHQDDTNNGYSHILVNVRVCKGLVDHWWRNWFLSKAVSRNKARPTEWMVLSSGHAVHLEPSVSSSPSDVGLLAQPLHPLHVALHGGGIGDLCGAAGGEPASLPVSHSLPVAPGWEEKTVWVPSSAGRGRRDTLSVGTRYLLLSAGQ